MFTDLINSFFKIVTDLPFDCLIYLILGSYAAIFLLVLILCLSVKKFRAASKRPFLCFTNAYAAVALAAFLFETELAKAIVAAAFFWVAGYLLYGVICLIQPKKERVAEPEKASQTPVKAPVKAPPVPPEAPPAKNTVRLEHAVAVTDKLLTKDLSKGDRQELEKMKNTLTVLQIKGTLTPVEGEILNENFNVLLKLMAKYNA